MIVRFRFYLATLVVGLLAATQLVTVISDRAFFLVIGLPVTLFSLVQLAGWQLRLRPRRMKSGARCRVPVSN